jgi:hypothetical protein
MNVLVRNPWRTVEQCPLATGNRHLGSSVAAQHQTVPVEAISGRRFRR